MVHEIHRSVAEILEGRDYERTKAKVVGQYRLGKTIGKGSFCKVKSAVHMVTKEKFAIKILQPQKPHNWAEIEREIAILRQIQHPNIIRIHDVLWSENKGNIHRLCVQVSEVKVQASRIFIVVELATGGELWHTISNGVLDEDKARRMFRQMVSGLEYCHMHLICHRDLKLENILLDDQNNVKISDFGLSNFMRPGVSMNTFCGTLAYAAPEILAQQSYIGFFVDIWSLGIILFAMLTGDVPWALDNESRKKAEMANLFAGKFHLPAGLVLSNDAMDLLQIMLQPNPKHRATLAQIRAHKWTNKGYDEAPARIFENYPLVTEVNETIIAQIALLGISEVKARKSILSNEPCPALCLYYTLLKKQQQIPPKVLLPPLIRAPNDTPTTAASRIPTLSISIAPPSPTTPPNKSPEFSYIHGDPSRTHHVEMLDPSHLSADPHTPTNKRHSLSKPKIISAPSSPMGHHSPSPLLSPTPFSAPNTPNSIFSITSPRGAPETRRKSGQLDPLLTSTNRRLSISKPTPSPHASSTPLSLSSSLAPPSPHSHPSPLAPPSPLAYNTPTSPHLSHLPLPKIPPASPHAPPNPLSSLTSPRPVGREEGEKVDKGEQEEVEVMAESEKRRSGGFRNLLGKLRGSKLPPLEV